MCTDIDTIDRRLDAYGVACNFLDIGLFDFLFVEGSGDEEQDDGLTGYNNDRYYRQVTCP